MFADEKSVEPGGAQADKIVVRAQAGFTDRDTMIGDAVDQLIGSFNANTKSFQIAIIDAEDAGVRGERATELGAGVNFDERLHAKLAAERDELGELRVGERGHNEKITVRIVGASFPHLPRVENEILAEHGQSDRFSGFPKILERAAKKFLLSEDGKRASTGGFEGTSQGDSIEGFAQNAAGGRCRLQFGKNVEAIAGQRRGEIAQRSGCFYPVLERGFGQNLLAVIDGGAPRIENAVEHGSGVRLSRH